MTNLLHFLIAYFPVWFLMGVGLCIAWCLWRAIR